MGRISLFLEDLITIISYTARVRLRTEWPPAWGKGLGEKNCLSPRHHVLDGCNGRRRESGNIHRILPVFLFAVSLYFCRTLSQCDSQYRVNSGIIWYACFFGGVYIKIWYCLFRMIQVQILYHYVFFFLLLLYFRRRKRNIRTALGKAAAAIYFCE